MTAVEVGGVPVLMGGDPVLWGWQPTAQLTASGGTLRRVVGDYGPAARIEVRLSTAGGEPLTGGPVTLRVGGLFVREMSHAGGGVWFVDPAADDLSRPGRFEVEVEVLQVTLPAVRPMRLRLRDRVEGVV